MTIRGYDLVYRHPAGVLANRMHDADITELSTTSASAHDGSRPDYGSPPRTDRATPHTPSNLGHQGSIMHGIHQGDVACGTPDSADQRFAALSDQHVLVIDVF